MSDPQQTASIEIQRIPDWPDRAVERLLIPWRKDRICALAAALGEGAQAQEDVVWDLLVSSGIDSATGDALDQWGELVGEQRGPLSDTEYRSFIKVRMLVNRSCGTIDELLAILDAATQPNVEVYHETNYPAGFYLVVVRQTFMGPAMRRRVARLMEDARPAGRHMSVIEAVSGGFGFEDDPDAKGFGVGPFSRLL